MFHKSHQKYVLFSCIDQVEEKRREKVSGDSRWNKKTKKEEGKFFSDFKWSVKTFPLLKFYFNILFPIFLQILLPIL